jgi:hypothetical protein
VSAGLARAAELQARAAQLQALRDPWLAEKGTTAAIDIQNRTTGAIRTLLATEDKTMPKEWQGLLRADEEYAPGMGHAEQTILNSVSDESEIVAGGTSRNVCLAVCAPLIDDAGLELEGPQFRGMPENTPFRMFSRNLQ